MKICTLLDKPEGRTVDIDADYIGFTVDDRFIVGYGLRTMPRSTGTFLTLHIWQRATE